MSRAIGFFGAAVVEKDDEAWSGQRKRVWSSDPVIRVSGWLEVRSLYRASESFLAANSQNEPH